MGFPFASEVRGLLARVHELEVKGMSPNGWMIIPCKIVPTYALFSSRRQIGLLNVLSFSSGSNLSFASVEA